MLTVKFNLKYVSPEHIQAIIASLRKDKLSFNVSTVRQHTQSIYVKSIEKDKVDSTIAWLQEKGYTNAKSFIAIQ